MQPFDLERALKGDKVVTRDGQEVTQICKICSNGIVGKINGKALVSYSDGVYTLKESKHPLDLFMAD